MVIARVNFLHGTAEGKLQVNLLAGWHIISSDERIQRCVKLKYLLLETRQHHLSIALFYPIIVVQDNYQHLMHPPSYVQSTA